MTYKDEAELRKACVEWQKILRIQDWEVRISFVGAQENDSAGGTCEVYFEMKAATIRISKNTAAMNAAEWQEEDHEHVLVHELLHIPFHPFEPKKGTWKYKMWEQAVDTLAKAYVAQKRKKPPAK